MISSTLPQVFRVRQEFERGKVDDVEAETIAQLASLHLEERIRPGQSVAITAGSRGISKIRFILRGIVTAMKQLGAQPFIVPAMGSHGGGTAEGQLRVLASYGITEEFCGCPIRSSMETVVVCQTAEGLDVHFDRHAYGADHTIVCNRIKPHTGFVGDIESGLLKMLLIGLGKHEGAKLYHRAVLNYSFPEIIRSAGAAALSRCKIAAGVAIVENGYDETAKIAAVRPEDFLAVEPELLRLAKRLLPRLPFDDIDLLVIDEIGKDISGTGMDTNVVGRKFISHQAAPDEFPKVKRILIRGLTQATHGNATGIGLAEFCTARALAQVNQEITRINCLTAGHVDGAMMPLDFPNDRLAIEAALSTIGMTPPEQAKLVWIRNTRDLSELECSPTLSSKVDANKLAQTLTPPRPLPFDAAGNLPTEGMRALAGE